MLNFVLFWFDLVAFQDLLTRRVNAKGKINNEDWFTGGSSEARGRGPHSSGRIRI